MLSMCITFLKQVNPRTVRPTSACSNKSPSLSALIMIISVIITVIMMMIMMKMMIKYIYVFIKLVSAPKHHLTADNRPKV